MKDLKIINGKIPCYDTDEFIEADILVHNGIIEKIGDATWDTKETIDAKGKIVSPGFIDMHSHEDPINAGNFKFFTSGTELMMGVTTKIAGNCGTSQDPLEDFVGNIKANGSPTNYLMFVGQNSLRKRVGATDRYKPSTLAEMDKMKRLLADAEKLHPIGLSCGFEYSPGVSADETIDLLSAFDKEGYLTSIHFRSDGADSVKSIEEMLYIGDKSHYGVQLSHIGSNSAVGFMQDAIDCVDKARAEGKDIMSDCYPYAAFSTGIGTAVFDEGCFEKWKKDYSDILITSGKYKNQRCTKEIFEEVRRDNPEIKVVAFVMNEPEVALAFQQPYVMVGSDCGFTDGCGHPRGAGTFPRVINRFVKELGAITLMDALKKMTIMPAERVCLTNKGAIKEGYDADIVIFDYDNIKDNATFTEPTLPPSGIEYVLMKGQVAVKGQEFVNNRLGEYIPYI